MICPYQYMKTNDIDFDRYAFGENDWIAMTWPSGLWYIGVIRGLSPLREREVLGHEIGHFLTGTTNNIHFSKYDEVKAETSWQEFLIPYDKLIEAIEEDEGQCDAEVLACKFGVSFDYMYDRLKRLFSK